MEISSLLIIVFFGVVRNKYRRMFKRQDKQNWMLVQAMCLVSILDILFVWQFNHANYPYPWLAALIRPFFLIYNIRVIRDFWERYIEVMIDTIPMVLFLIVFILYFSWMG